MNRIEARKATCVHSTRTPKGVVLERCDKPVLAGRPNGYLCEEHDAQVFGHYSNTPVQLERLAVVRV